MFTRRLLLLACTLPLLVPSAASAFISVLEQVRLSSNEGGLGPISYGTEFGRSAVAVSDLNGDGYDDLLVGRTEITTEPGSVSVLFLDANREVVSETLLEAGVNGVPANATASFGYALAAIGDLDGDGTDDVAVSSPVQYINPSGTVWILFLNPDGTVKASHEISAANLAGLQDNDFFGSALSFLGDRDSDGDPEIAVGARRYGVGAGAVWILELDTDGTVTSSRRIADGQAGLSGFDQHEQFGVAVSRIVDLDGNGADDLAVGSYRDVDTSRYGVVTILFLDSVDSVIGTQVIGQGEGGLVGSPGFTFGASLAWLDNAGCGRSALAVGAPLASSSTGEVWILELDANGLVVDEQELSNAAGTLSGPTPHAGEFGLVSALGDLDGNGITDLAVGAPRHGGAGAVWTFWLTNYRTAPGYLDFGYAYTGDVVDSLVTLTNEGCATVAGTISASGADYQITSGGGAFSLDPGESLDVGVRFVPIDGNERVGLLDTGSAFGTVDLTGIGRIPVDTCFGRWNLDTFNAANLAPGPDNHALWCGVQAGEPGYVFPPGHGNNWDEPLMWASAVDPFAPSIQLRLRFDYNLDLASGEFVVERTALGSWTELFSTYGSTRDSTGAFTTPTEFDLTFDIPAEDRIVVAGEQGVAIRLRVNTGNYSDENFFDTDGAVQIDNLQVWIGGELVSDADFEPGGSDGGWCTAPDIEIPDVEDYWHAGFEAPPGGNGLDGEIRSMLVYQNQIVVGGAFTQAGSVTTNRIASFDGTNWHALGGGFADGMVWALAEYGGKLYAAGDFTIAGGSPADYLAVWDGTSWQATGANPANTVWGLGKFDGKLYFADYQIGHGGQPYVNEMEIYDGVSWTSQVGPGGALVFQEYQGALHFTRGGKLYRMDGTNYTLLGEVNNDVYDMEVHDGLLVLGGIWNIPPPGGSYGMTGWDGSDWVALPQVSDTGVNSLANYNGRLIVAGNLHPAVTSLDDGVYRPMGNPYIYSGEVFASVVWNGSYWAGGTFDNMAGKPSNYFAKWTDPIAVASPAAPPADRRRVMLSAGHPNPFNPMVSFVFSIPSPGRVRIGVFDLRGRRVATLLEEARIAGAHPVSWNGRDSNGHTVASGSYVVRIEHDAGIASRRVVLLK